MHVTSFTACRRLALRAFVIVFAALFPAVARAQANSGALDLLLPIGARSTAMGAAFVAEQGSEAVWWNPAGIARLTTPEFALDHFETFFIKGDAVAIILPIRGVGALGISARLFNYGEFEGTDSVATEQGLLLSRTLVAGATFSSSLGSRLDAGVTYHLYQGRNDCTGVCRDATSFATSAVDLGLQLRPFNGRALRLGLAVRNVGPRLQVKDQAQADALPTRINLGASYDPVFPGIPRDLAARLTAEVVTNATFAAPELHMGVQVGYSSGKSRVVGRAGYVIQQESSGATGPSLGFGLASGRVQLDVARVFETFNTGLGVPPTYFSIRLGL